MAKSVRSILAHAGLACPEDAGTLDATLQQGESRLVAAHKILNGSGHCFEGIYGAVDDKVERPPIACVDVCCVKAELLEGCQAFLERFVCIGDSEIVVQE